MSCTPDSKNDKLGLAGNSKTAKMLNKSGSGSPERVFFSAIVTKINRKNAHQDRILLITDQALYNMMPNVYGKHKRRIPMRQVTGVTASTTSPEFVVHVSDEYDYRYTSQTHQKTILGIMEVLYAQIPGNENRKAVAYSSEPNLEKDVLTKKSAKVLSREQRQLRKQKLLEKLGQKDKEEEEREQKGDVGKFSQLMETKEKVTLKDFQLMKVLGRGSFGKVMLVKKKDNGKFYAMKILRKDVIIKRNQITNTKAERAILQQCQHPFLMTLRFAFQSSSKLYLVLDFYQGGELFYHLKNERRFTERTAKIYVGEIALALGHLHSTEVIYRDLKPENILLGPDGHVCLTDFGLAKEVGEGETTSSFCGTPEYLAPEIVASLGHDKAVDWWSLGILLYELTVGIPPFYSQNVNEMYEKIQHGVLRFPPFLSENCQSLIAELLNRDPAERCGSKNDVEDIKQHPFFDDIDWDKMYAKQVIADYQPEVKADKSALFESEFTAEPVVETMVNPTTLVKQNDAHFKGFTFVEGSNPLSKS